MVVIGNHDNKYNGTVFANRFRMPSNGNGNFYYSYKVGPVHIIAFSTDGPMSDATNSPEFVWLEKDLNSVDRSQTPWVVFSTHRPIYSSTKKEADQHKRERELLEPVLLKHKVDLVLVGHVHSYERVYPNINGVPVVNGTSNVYINPTAPAYVVQGTGGSFLTLPTNWVQPQPGYSANRALHYGYGMLDANVTHIHYAFVLEKDGSIYDDFWIVKDQIK
jgi:hypothetical protein